MIVISDTNILSSLAAGDAFPSLFPLFVHAEISIPSAVLHELQAGLDKGKTYLQPVLEAILVQQIAVIPLSPYEEQLIYMHPTRLNLGERQAIALTQTRNALLLSNDKRAVRYCQEQGIRVLNLENILRQLWLQKILSLSEVKQMIERMARIENLVLTPERQAIIFAPQHPR